MMCSAGFAHTGLTYGLSRMTGNCHVRFLGEGAAAMPLPYPTAEILSRLSSFSFLFRGVQRGYFSFTSRIVRR